MVLLIVCCLRSDARSLFDVLCSLLFVVCVFASCLLLIVVVCRCALCVYVVCFLCLVDGRVCCVLACLSFLRCVLLVALCSLCWYTLFVAGCLLIDCVVLIVVRRCLLFV